MESGKAAGTKPWRTETIRGEPYLVGQRRLVPVARVVALGKAKGTVGTKRVGGWGGGFVRITPLSIQEQTTDGERTIAVTDGTATAVCSLFVTALVLTVLLAGVRTLARRLRRA
jgi:hypothetical protein